MPRPRNPKVCVDCGNDFWPNSGVQKRCESCRGPKPKGRGAKPPSVRPSRRKREPRLSREERVQRFANTAAGMKVAERMRRIEEESYARFREERGDG